MFEIIVHNYKKIFENYGVTHVITYSDSRVSKKLKSNSDYKKIYPLTEEERALDERFVIYEKVQNN